MSFRYVCESSDRGTGSCAMGLQIRGSESPSRIFSSSAETLPCEVLRNTSWSSALMTRSTSASGGVSTPLELQLARTRRGGPS